MRLCTTILHCIAVWFGCKISHVGIIWLLLKTSPKKNTHTYTKNPRLKHIKQWQLFTKWKIVIQTIRIMFAYALTFHIYLSSTLCFYLYHHSLIHSCKTATGSFYYLLWKHIILFVLHFRPWNRSFYIVMWY